MSRAASNLRVSFVVALGVSLGGCPETTTSRGNAPLDEPAPAKSAAVDAGAGPKLVEFSEADFTESDRNRDPFRSYAGLFVEQKRGPVQSQLATVLGQFSLDELKLVAVVRAADYPRAMLRDPNGRGWVIKKGDYVGRAEMVHSGGQNGTDYMLNWRVERVRDGDVVFVREGPGQPNVAPARRVLALRTEAEREREALQN